MNRLGVRLALSHLVVAIVGGLTTFLVVGLLAPALFDSGLHLGPGGGGSQGGGYGQTLRATFAAAVTNAMVVGTLAGAFVAAVLGALAARRLVRPLQRTAAAVDELARGNYSTVVPVPDTAELAALVTDVNALGRQLAETEGRRLRLLGEVAHELRTPLTVIDGYVEGMLDGVLKTTPEALGQISTEVRRLRRLGDDLSALSRAEEGRLALETTTVDLDALADSLVGRLRPQATDAGLTLSFAPGAGSAVADADRTVSVLTNLIGNAIRATPSGGTITVAGSRIQGHPVLSVRDTGEGLARDELERVFERFYRAGASTASGGSGIGLTIARAIMRAQGGDLTAASDGLSRGATFTATFD